MGVKTYSASRDGNKYLSDHFRVQEFRCKDGSDEILISDELVAMLEKLRAKLSEDLHGEVRVNINSGYRTKAHNKKVGGSATSKHCKGLAADIICKKDGKTVQSKYVCTAAQDLDMDGIAYINSGSTHVDCRGYRWWADETMGNKQVSDFYAYFSLPYPTPTATVKKGDKGTPVRWMQDKLCKAGAKYKVAIDGSFGPASDKALRKYQSDNGLECDGRCGPATRKSLSKY